MSNPIKYSTGSESNALKKGNLYIGTGDVGKGPSDVTGFYQGVSPSAGGYVIYMNKSGAPGGLSYHNAPTDAELISFTNNLAGESYTTVNECLVYYAGQSDKVCLNRDYESIVTDGLVFNLDAGFTPSYPKNGTTWYDVSTNTNNGTLTNGPTFSSDDGGSVLFDGVDDYVSLPNLTYPTNTSTTIEIVQKFNNNLLTPSTNQINFVLSGIKTGSVDAGNFLTLSNVNSVPAIIFKSRILWSTSQNLYSYQVYYQIIGNGMNNYPVIVQSFYNEDATLNSQTINYPQITSGLFYYTWSITNSDLGTRSTSHYLNGNKISVITDVQSQDFNFFNLNSLRLGYQSNSNIYICRIYNRPLSATEVLQNYNAQKGRFGL